MLNVYEAFIKVKAYGCIQFSSVVENSSGCCELPELDECASNHGNGTFFYFLTFPAASEKFPMVSGAFSQLQRSAARRHSERAASASHEQVQSATKFQ